MQIILYLDQGTSLSLYNRIGTLDREMAIYRKLIKRGHSVTILSWSKGEDSELLEQIAPIKVIQNTSRLPNRLWMLHQLLKLRRKKKSDMIVLTNQLFGAYLAAFVKLFVGYKLIVRFGYLTSENFRSSDGQYSKNHLKSLINEFFSLLIADHIITTSEKITETLTRRLPWIKSKIDIVPNYVDKDIFFPNKKDSDSENFSIVSTGRLSKEKRYPLLIKALSKLTNVELSIIGEGPDKPALQELAKKCAVPVKFLGTIPNSELPHIYNISDMFILCSEYEGHPKALIEAMSCAMPIIATNVRGINDVLIDNKTGKLVEADVEILAAEIKKLIDSPELRNKFGSASAIYSNKYSLSKYTKSFEVIFQRVIGY